MKTVSACISVRLAVRCFYTIFLPGKSVTLRLLHASLLDCVIDSEFCCLSFLVDLSFVLVHCFALHDFINMSDYIPHEIIHMILILGKCRGNYRAAARLYREQYPDRRYPTSLRNCFQCAR